MAVNRNEFITPDEAVTLDGLFRERVKRTPGAVAYRDFNQRHANWRDYTWAQIDFQVARWHLDAHLHLGRPERSASTAPRGGAGAVPPRFARVVMCAVRRVALCGRG